jgi:hypothetical protein
VKASLVVPLLVSPFPLNPNTKSARALKLLPLRPVVQILAHLVHPVALIAPRPSLSLFARYLAVLLALIHALLRSTIIRNPFALQAAPPSFSLLAHPRSITRSPFALRAVLLALIHALLRNTITTRDIITPSLNPSRYVLLPLAVPLAHLVAQSAGRVIRFSPRSR